MIGSRLRAMTRDRPQRPVIGQRGNSQRSQIAKYQIGTDRTTGVNSASVPPTQTLEGGERKRQDDCDAGISFLHNLLLGRLDPRVACYTPELPSHSPYHAVGAHTPDLDPRHPHIRQEPGVLRTRVAAGNPLSQKGAQWPYKPA